MLKQIFSAGAAVMAFSAMAAAEISVSSTPALPTANLLQNASFEDGKLAPWRAFGGTVELDTADKADGAASVKITGDPAKRPGLSQVIRPKDVQIKAKDLYYIKVKAKNSGADPELGKRAGSVAWQVSFSDGAKASYMRAPEMPLEEYGWTEFEMTFPMAHDFKNATFYLCYYNQEGTQWFDEVIVSVWLNGMSIRLTCVRGRALFFTALLTSTFSG